MPWNDDALAVLRDYLSDINITQSASALNMSRSRLSTAMRPRLKCQWDQNSHDSERSGGNILFVIQA
ncbi:hypothetical protein [Salmonella enterica]